jgi:TonB family protein
MFQWKRTSLFFTLPMFLVLLLQQTQTGVAQAERFQENMQKGETALNQRNYEAAVSAYKNAARDARAVTGASASAATAQANLGLSRAFMGLGAFKNAIQSCDEALKHVGTNTALEGMVRNQKGLAIVASVTKPGDANLEQAITEFRRVLEISDQNPIVFYNLGVALLKMNRDAEGVHELQGFLARAGRTPEAETARRLVLEPRRARENFAPDFSVTTLDGEFVTLEDLRGKVVLLDFWGTWCPPCRESTPSLVRYSKRHSPELFTIVGVAVSEPSEQGWRDYVAKNKMEWPQYLDSTRKISSLFKVTGFPTYIIIDAEGVIRERRTGWNGDTMAILDDHVRKAVKAREKAGPPVLKPSVETAAPRPSTMTSTAPTVAPATVTATGLRGVAAVPQPIPGDGILPAGVSVRGRVNRLPGAAAALRVNLILPGPQPVTTSAVVAPDGSFEFFNVRPGNYNLAVSAPVPFQPIVVGNTDVSGIEFTVPAVKSIAGRVVMEGTGALPPRVIFSISYPNGTTTVGPPVQLDGTFTIALPEGERRLGITVPGYSVRSFAFGSLDLLRENLNLSSSDTEQLLVTLIANPSGTPGRGAPGLSPIPPVLPAGRGAQTNGVTTQPVVLSQIQARYTDQARQAGIQGIVILRAIVRKDGSVDSIQVVQGLGWGLDEAAADALRQWRFRPATMNGQAVDFTMNFTMNFAVR